MKRKTRFSDGGLNKPEGGRFDEDLYARARRFIEENERRAGEGMANEESPAPVRRRAPIPAPPVTGDVNYGNEGRSRPAPSASGEPSYRRTMGADRTREAPSYNAPGQIPKETDVTAPESDGSSMPNEFVRNLANTAYAMTPGVVRGSAALGRGLGALGSSAREGWREGTRISKELAEATERGAATRAATRAKRAERMKGEAQAMEEAKPALQARRNTKPDRVKQTRYKEDEAGVEFSKGGSVSRRADGIAQRGKTRGKIY